MSRLTFDVARNRDGSIRTIRYHILFVLGLAIVIAMTLLVANSTISYAQTVAACNPDSNGANDAVGQGDLTRFCSSGISSSYTQTVTISWDKINWTGQSGDACLLYNTDGDAGINYSLCFSVAQDSGGNVIYTGPAKAYSCNDRTDKPVNCFNPTPTTLLSATCQASVTSTDPFYSAAHVADNGSPIGTGEAYPKDTTLSCTVTYAGDLTTTLPVLANVCAYTQPGDAGSNAKDCLAFEGGGFLTINKVAIPDDSNALFNFNISGTSFSQSAQIAGSGSSDHYNVKAGTFAIAEIVPSTWQLDQVVCTNATNNGTFSDPLDSITNIIIGANQDVTCTFTNTALPPSLSITKTADQSSVDAGDQVGYTITISNTGTGIAKDVIVNDSLPAGLTWVESPDLTACSIDAQGLLTCNFGDIPSGGSYSVHVIATSGANNCGLLTNIASYSSANGGSAASTAATIDVNCPSLDISKTADQGTVNAGESIGFTIVVSNTGEGAAKNVVVTDILPAGFAWVESPDVSACSIAPNGSLTCDFGTLAKDATVSVHITATTTAENCGAVNNNVSLTSTNGGTDNASASITVECPNISVVKGFVASPITAGDIATYTIHVSNSGPGAATNVTITDTLPSGINWSVDNADCSITGQELSCRFPTLANGGDLDIQVYGTTNAAVCGTLRNSVTVAAANESSDALNNNVSATSITVQCPDLSVTKSADNSPISAGDTASFTILVVNNGSGEARDITVTDNLPAGVNWSTSTPGCAIDAGVLTCSYATLANIDSISIQVSGVTSSANCGTLDNSVSVTAANEDASTTVDNEADATIAVNCAQILITKTADAPSVTAGDAIGFLITVGNAGEGIARTVNLSDVLPVATGVNWQIDGGSGLSFCSIDGTGKLACSFGDLAPLAELSVHISSPTTADSCGTINNTAEVTTSNDGSGFASDQIVVNCPNVTVLKEAVASPINSGDTATYSITVSNIGQGIAHNVVLTDVLPAGVSWQLAAPVAGCSIANGTLSCLFDKLTPAQSIQIFVSGTTDAEDCGPLSNQAEVSASNENSSNQSDNLADAAITVNCPDVEVTKLAVDGTIDAGDVATYTIEVRNSGIGLAKDVRLTDILPLGVTWSENSEQCTITNGVLACTFGDLASNAVRTVTVSGVTDAQDCGVLRNTATVSATNEAASTNATNESSAEITVNCPNLEITKSADDQSVSAGDKVGFTIAIFNSGPGTAKSVVLSDQLPTGLSWTIDPANSNCSINSSNLLTCTLGDLASNSGVTVHVTATTQPANCGTLSNQASFTSGNGGTEQSNSVAITVNCPLLSIVKLADKSTVNAGEEVGYAITVTNAGPGIARAVTVTDQLPAGLDWLIDPDNSSCSISAGGLLRCDFGDLGDDESQSVHVVATTSSANCGQLTNLASYESTNGGTGTSQPATITVNCPNLSISKQADQSVVSAGDEIGFTITVANAGPGTAKSVMVSDTLPANLTWLESPNLDACTISSIGLLLCSFGDIASGANASVHITATTTVANCGTVNNLAEYTSSNGGTDLSNVSSIRVECPDLTVSKVADAASVSAGDTVGYLITVSNAGPGRAYAVTVNDTLPTNADLSWVIDGGTGAGQCSIAAGELTCDWGTLEAGASKTVHISSATSPATCGTINNLVTVTSSNDSPDPASASITVHCPNVSVLKESEQDTVSAGDIITFTITVNKVGEGVAKAVIVSDTLPAGIVWSEDSANCAIADGKLGCDFGDLSGDATRVVHVWGTTDAADCGLISNTAVVEVANEAETQRGDNSSTATVSVKCPDIEVVKLADQEAINAGDTAGYTIVITNTGEGLARDVELADTLPSGVNWSEDSAACAISSGVLNCSFGTLSSGESRTVHLTGTTDAADCGPLVNLATASASNEDDATLANNRSEATINVRCPNLSVIKSADKSPINAGEVASFTITVTNNGAGIARNVTLSDTLTPGIAWSEDSNDCSISGGLLSCDFGDLASDASKTVHVTGITDAADCSTIINIVETKAGNEASTALGDNKATAELKVLCPDIKVTKTAVESTISAGDTASFKLVVTNVGMGLATNVTLSDTLPSGISWTEASDVCSISGNLLSCEFGDLATNDVRTVIVSGVTAAANCGTLNNTAEVRAANEATADANNNQSTATISVQCADIILSKVADADAVSAGDPIGYVITVTNNGLGTARSVLITDTLPTNDGLNWSIIGGTGAAQCQIAAGKLTCNFGDLVGGATKTVHISSPTTSASCGVVDNEVMLTTTNAGSNEASDQVVVNCPNVTLLKSADKATIDAGDTISFTLLASNSGTGVARNVTLSDTLPTGVAWNEDSSACSITGGVLSCNFGDLAAGATRTVHVWGVSRAANCGVISNKAEVKATNESSNDTSDNLSTAVVTVNCPELSIVKSADQATVNDGEQIGFTIVVNNSGAGAAKNVVLTDTLPGGLTWSISPENAACSISGGLLTCNYGTIPSGESRTVHIVATTSIKNCGTLSNTAYVSLSNGSAKTSQAVSITVNCPKLSISKVSDAAEVNYGTPIAFTIRVKNDGTGPARNVLLTDTLPTGAGISWSIANVAGDASCSIATNTLTCSIAVLDPGAEFSVRIVSQTLYACQTLANTASSSASNNPVVKASATITVRCLHPGTIGFWRNWRNKYSDTQMDKLISYIQVNNASVYSNTGKLTRTIVDAIFNYGTKPPTEQQILGQLTSLKLNLAVTACNGTAGVVQYNDNLCLSGIVNVSGISGAQTFFDLDKNGVVTVGEVVKKVESLWSGKLTTNRADWKFSKVPVTKAQQSMIISVLAGINEGKLVLTSGCTSVTASANSDTPAATDAIKRVYLPVISR